MLKIERLIAEATPRPWKRLHRKSINGEAIFSADIRVCNLPKCADRPYGQKVADADMLCALANSAPELVALVKAAKEIFNHHCLDVVSSKGDGCSICKALANLQQRPEWREE